MNPVVRAMDEADLSSVVAIAAIVPTAPHWPPSEFVRMLQLIAQQPQRRGAWVADLGGIVLGFAMATQVAGTAELEAVVTAPTERRRGVGAALLSAVKQWSVALGAERLLLEARASNEDALRLYRRFDFVQNGCRRGYYTNPVEDALLFTLDLRTAAVLQKDAVRNGV